MERREFFPVRWERNLVRSTQTFQHRYFTVHALRPLLPVASATRRRREVVSVDNLWRWQCGGERDNIRYLQREVRNRREHSSSWTAHSVSRHLCFRFSFIQRLSRDEIRKSRLTSTTSGSAFSTSQTTNHLYMKSSNVCQEESNSSSSSQQIISRVSVESFWRIPW